MVLHLLTLWVMAAINLRGEIQLFSEVANSQNDRFSELVFNPMQKMHFVLVFAQNLIFSSFLQRLR
jgi:hypothetical protein